MASLSALPEETLRGLRAMDEAFVRAVAVRDAAALVDGFYADDACLQPPDGPMLTGVPSIVKYWEGRLAAGVQDFELHTARFEVSGNLAYGVGQFTMTIGPPGLQGAPTTGAYLAVYRRRDSTTWRAVAEMFSNERS